MSRNCTETRRSNNALPKTRHDGGRSSASPRLGLVVLCGVNCPETLFSLGFRDRTERRQLKLRSLALRALLFDTAQCVGDCLKQLARVGFDMEVCPGYRRIAVSE